MIFMKNLGISILIIIGMNFLLWLWIIFCLWVLKFFYFICWFIVYFLCIMLYFFLVYLLISFFEFCSIYFWKFSLFCSMNFSDEFWPFCGNFCLYQNSILETSYDLSEWLFEARSMFYAIILWKDRLVWCSC